ncbi:MAG TPA: energy transducer TonB [Gemmatimonadales bacterium]|nr:energy transducer TonB [Gemmatimonadales bacterium]
MRQSTCFALAVVLCGGRLSSQSRAARLVDSARSQLSANHADSAAALLRIALDSATGATTGERVNALVWEGIVQFAKGDETGTRIAFREACTLDGGLDIKGLEQMSPQLSQIFQHEKAGAIRRRAVYVSGDVDDPPRRLSGPPIAYPGVLLRRHVQGFIEVTAVIDTTGRPEASSVEVLSTPDSALIGPAKQMMLATLFSPGHRKGAAVRVMVQMNVDVRPPRLDATELTGRARAELAAGHADSAQRLLEIALDTVVTHPTDGERLYVLLVRGIAATQAGQDSAARGDLEAGVALYQTLTARGVDLAPFLRHLADSVRLARRATTSPGDVMPPPTAARAAEQPVLVSHPAIHYPPEMQALRIAATVVVEAILDATGHVEPQTAKIVQSPNHAFDREALRVVRGSEYQPAKNGGRPVRVVIRQAVRFINY